MNVTISAEAEGRCSSARSLGAVSSRDEKEFDESLRPAAAAGNAEREQLQSLASRYEALLRASRAINAYREPVAFFRALASELQNAVKFDYVALLLYQNR